MLHTTRKQMLRAEKDASLSSLETLTLTNT